MHKAEQIIDNVTARVSTVTELQEVLYGQLEKPSVYPSVSISMGDDETERFNLSVLKQTLSILIDIYVSSNSPNLDKSLLSIRDKIHNAIMVDRNLALNYVQEMTFAGQQAPTYVQDGDDYSATVRLEFSVAYLTNIETQSV